MNIRALLVFFALIVSSVNTASAKESDKWVEVASTDSSTFSLRVGSYERATTTGGKAVAVIIGRRLSTKSTQVVLEKWYVSIADCRAAHGQLVTLSISGDFKFENSWVDGAGSVASGIASVICAVDDKLTREAASKGI